RSRGRDDPALLFAWRAPMNRMFQVIVVVGISLTAHACGGTVQVAAQGSATGSGGMPTTVGGGGFPQEGRTSLTPSSTSGSGGFGGFPQEGPAMMFDAGVDAPMVLDAGHDGCFMPIETAIACIDASSGSDAASDAGNSDAADGGFPHTGPQ